MAAVAPLVAGHPGQMRCPDVRRILPGAGLPGSGVLVTNRGSAVLVARSHTTGGLAVLIRACLDVDAACRAILIAGVAMTGGLRRAAQAQTALEAPGRLSSAGPVPGSV